MKEALVTLGIAVLAVGLIFGSAVFNLSWNTSGTDDELGPIESRPILDYTPLPESERFHGLAIQLHNRYGLAGFRKSIHEVAELGADTVLLSVAGYQENGSSSSIATAADPAPNKEEVASLIREAKDAGLRVIVMPIVLLTFPRGNEWRGKIVPTDADKWWADYREFIRTYAEAASQSGADLFMVGSELNKMEPNTSRWKSLIEFLRRNYPNLKLGYSSNWDRYWKISFWKYLDFAGMTSYYELAEGRDTVPTVDDIADAWSQYMTRDGVVHHYRDKIVAWQRTIGKPVIFTEVGYFTKKGTAYEPWNYYRESPLSQEEQANCYQAFLKVWQDHTGLGKKYGGRSPWDGLGGTIFWEWSSNDQSINPKTGKPWYDPDTDDSYMPKGKLAEQVLRNYFREVSPAKSQPAGTGPAASQPVTSGPAASGTTTTGP